MLKLLVANGCSHTRGVELPDPATEAWPAILARKLGTDHVNLGCGGGSNRRIVRTTLAALDAICRERSLLPREVLVVCLWTHPARHEYYSPKRSRFAKDRPDLADELNWHRILPHGVDDHDKASSVYYRNLWTAEGGLANFYMDWVLLDGWLRSARYSSRYGFAFPGVADQLPAVAQPFTQLLVPDAILGGFPQKPGTAFLEITAAHPRGPGGHALREGHALFADTLAAWLAADPRLELPVGHRPG